MAGGWAIDLFLATRTRDHEDPEIARELSASSFIVAAATSMWRRGVAYGSLQWPRDLTMAGMPLGTTSHSVCWGGGRACSE